MLRITAVALACLSLAVIQPMGVAGRLHGGTVGGAMYVLCLPLYIGA